MDCLVKDPRQRFTCIITITFLLAFGRVNAEHTKRESFRRQNTLSTHWSQHPQRVSRGWADVETRPGKDNNTSPKSVYVDFYETQKHRIPKGARNSHLLQKKVNVSVDQTMDDFQRQLPSAGGAAAKNELSSTKHNITNIHYGLVLKGTSRSPFIQNQHVSQEFRRNYDRLNRKSIPSGSVFKSGVNSQKRHHQSKQLPIRFHNRSKQIKNTQGLVKSHHQLTVERDENLREIQRQSITKLGRGLREIRQNKMFLSPGEQNTIVKSYVDKSPCTTAQDTQYGGFLMDCSNKNIQIFQKNWIVPNTTTIKLDNNNIDKLEDDCFLQIPQLRYLDLNRNRFRFLKSEWFRGIERLQVLDLNYNSINLDRKSFTGEAFRFLLSLTRLGIGWNGNLDTYGEYPDFLLGGPQRLDELTLDTFATDLNFGLIFNNSTFLTCLTLTGGVRKILNDSFEPFRSKPLKTLHFENLVLLEHTELDAFSPLQSLNSLTMHDVGQELNATLLSLKPFVGRNFTTLSFEKIGSTYKEVSTFEGNKVITTSIAQYLREICVETLEIKSSCLFYISYDLLMSQTFARCLKAIDLSDNPLKGELNAYFSLNHLRSLVSLILSNRDVHMPHLPSYENAKCSSISNTNFASYIPYNFSHLNESTSQMIHNVNGTGENSMIETQGSRRETTVMEEGRYTSVSNSELQKGKMTNRLEETQDKNGGLDFHSNACRSEHTISAIELLSFLHTSIFNIHRKGKSCIRIPRSLKVLYFSGLSENMISLSFKVDFSPNTLRELYFAENGIKDMTGQLLGLNHLQILEMSRNYGNLLRTHFFDHFPSLKILFMQEMKLDAQFFATSSSRLFHELISLEIIDLSLNGLSVLSAGTFKTTKLKILILAKNRFRNIPVSISNLPDLCVLDLSYNSITALSRDEMDQLDEHANKKFGFTLKLKGNVLSCTCSNFRFLSWLQRTTVKLDHSQNLYCMDERGKMYDIRYFQHLDEFWRKCYGKTALFISILLLLLISLAFTVAILLFQFQTRLSGYIHQVILRRVKPKMPSDYSIGVYLSYSDQDASIACIPLREFIETELRLTTFLRHRDLLPNQYRDVSIANAIRQSWRVLLVVTESYLTLDHWSFYVMKLASSSATTTNQGKVVLLVEEGLGKKLPDCLLKVTKEGNVIPMETRLCDVCSPDIRARLRKALTYDYALDR